ncbi:hypothetical protein OIU74_021839 [Salix koriyanagi]|uniref:Uncharacterized protein n=1 Tax=Salix koriyanagi TaxID=2511006 RepID=A0A9Q0WKH7_9ROSI|nr:hypothetical protein OIU74_021839 [Salix koriyanagi]
MVLVCEEKEKQEKFELSGHVGECKYSAKVWKAVSQRGQIIWSSQPWLHAWEEAVQRYNSKKNPRHRVAGLVIASTIYHLWKERNNRVHNHHFSGTQRTEDDIINTIRERLANLGAENQALEGMLHQWNIN